MLGTRTSKGKAAMPIKKTNLPKYRQSVSSALMDLDKVEQKLLKLRYDLGPINPYEGGIA